MERLSQVKTDHPPKSNKSRQKPTKADKSRQKSTNMTKADQANQSRCRYMSILVGVGCWGGLFMKIIGSPYSKTLNPLPFSHLPWTSTFFHKIQSKSPGQSLNPKSDHVTSNISLITYKTVSDI